MTSADWIEAAADHVLLVGSYSSALDRAPLVSDPPVTSTCPLLSSVAVPTLAVTMEPAEDQLLLTGSYSSALDRSLY